MLPLVTVVIPSYNAAPWIEETLQSVVDQTIDPRRLEVIVIDDKSPDDSVERARRFLAKTSLDARVVERERNGGVTVTRNVGFRLARGEWIQFLDQDDLLTKDKLAAQAAVAQQAPPAVSVVYSGWQYYELLDGKWRPDGQVRGPVVDDDPVVRILEDWTFGYVGPTLIRKRAIESIGGFIERVNIAEDTELLLRIAMDGGQFQNVPLLGPGLLYRQSPTSLWRAYAKNVAPMRNMLLTVRSAEQFLRQQSPAGVLSDRARVAIARRYLNHAEFYLRNDRDSFRDIISWVRALDCGHFLPGQSRGMKTLTRAVGYENALLLKMSLQRSMAVLRETISRYRD